MNKDLIYEMMKENIIEVLGDMPTEAIAPEKRLKDLGANSIDRVEIITMTMERLGLKIPLVEFGSMKAIGDLTSFFHEKRNMPN